MRPLTNALLSLVVLAPLAAACSSGNGGPACTGEGDAPCSDTSTSGTEGSGDGSRGGEDGSQAYPGGSSGSSEPGSSSSSSSGGSSSGSSSSNVECVGDADNCFCGEAVTAWGASGSSQKVQTCSKASTGSEFCCAGAGYPGSGSCWCQAGKPNCHKSVFGDSCSCSLVAPERPDLAVSTCTAKTGGVCCVEPGDIAPMCTCWDKLTTCPSGKTKVSSCSVSNVQCAGTAVSVCK